jgi:O-antigen/teichoic acid export membrane protein
MSRVRPFAFLASNLAAQLVVMASWALSARNINLESMSQVVATISIATFASVLIDSGHIQTYFVELSHDAKKKGNWFAVLLVLLSNWIKISIVEIPLLLFLDLDLQFELFIIFYSLLLTLSRFSTSAARVLVTTRKYLAVSPVARVAGICTIILLIQSSNNFFLPMFLMLSEFLTIVIAFLLIRPPGSRWRKLQKPSSALRPYNLSISAAGLDAFLLSLVGTHVTSALLGTLGKLMQPLGLLSTSSTQSIAVELLRAKNKTDLREIRKQLILPFSFIAIVASLFAVYADFFIVNLLGAQYSDSGNILPLLAFAVLPGSANQVISTFLQGQKEFRFLNVVLMATTISYLILICFFGYQHPTLTFYLIPAYQVIIFSAFALKVMKISEKFPD